MTKLVSIARGIMTLSMLLLLPLLGCRDLEPEPGSGQSETSEVEQQLPIIIPPIVLNCDNIFSDAGCKGKVGGAACAPPAGGKCQPIAPIGNGFYDCLCTIPPPPPPPGDGGPVDGGPVDGPVDAGPVVDAAPANEAGGEDATLIPRVCGKNGPFCDNNTQCGFLCGWPGGACNLTTRCCACYPMD